MDLTMFMEVFTLAALPGLLTLIILELVLGIDNVIFISILSGKLPEKQRAIAQKIGLGLALVLRIGLLFAITWIITLTNPVMTLPLSVLPFELADIALSWRDLILLGGGFFLLWKAGDEIHEELEGKIEKVEKKASASFMAVIGQIVVMDAVFSFDSILTAVGMVSNIGVMIVAVMVAVLVMMTLAKPIGDFVHANPPVKMLALSFLMIIGVTLIADGLHHHIPKGYIYAALGFSVLNEALNVIRRRNRKQATTGV